MVVVMSRVEVHLLLEAIEGVMVEVISRQVKVGRNLAVVLMVEVGKNLLVVLLVEEEKKLELVVLPA